MSKCVITGSMGVVIRKQPGDFSSAFCEAVYVISGAQGITDVEVLKSDGEVLGVKRFRCDSEIEVNIAGYVQRCLVPEPCIGDECLLWMSGGRCVAASVRVDGQTSAGRLFTAALKDLAEFEIMSGLPRIRKISYGETDEISFPLPNKKLTVSLTVSGNGFSFDVTDEYLPGKCIATFVLNMDHVGRMASARGYNAESVERVSVSLGCDGVWFCKMDYAVVPRVKNAVRLCWLNALGGVDYYTFGVAISEKLQVNKERIVTSGGYRSIASSPSRVLEVGTGFITAGELAAVTEILCASKVWRVCDDGKVLPVDVLTDSAIVRSKELMALKLSFREQNVVNYQSF